MFEAFIDKLKKQLQEPLPGENAQFAMAPVSRERMKELNLVALKPKKSAVLVLIYNQNDSFKTVLIQRPTYDGVHSAQIAFPGGKFEETDIDLLHTALRETQEEIGIDTQQLEIIGKLTDVYISPSNFLVSPFIAYTSQTPIFKADTREVERIITTDILGLNDSNIKGIKTITHSNGYKIKSPYYNIEGHTVWGATAMMISELNAILERS